jgi:hypothetical protein
MPFEYEKVGTKSGSKKGTFIGNPAATHIHLVGGNDHLKVQDARRYEIRWARSTDNQNPAKKADIDKMREGYADLQNCAGTPGVADCKLWVRSYLIDYHGVNPAKVPL